KGDTCIICFEAVEERTSYSTLVCPACRNAWFHSHGAAQHRQGPSHMLLMFVLKGLATSAGFGCFKCPQCRDDGAFLVEMHLLGIDIPRRSPSWESRGAYAALSERHSLCDATRCLCPQGRQYREGEG
ncbi:G2E3 ligase, partial [Bucco capensis]|nr:G2E3 ligase [Bucco capensis]